MLKSIWNASKARVSETPETTAVNVDADLLTALVEHFPIGRKLRYYPEFHRNVALDSILIAYRVNGHFVYSQEGVRCDAEGRLVEFRTDSGKRIPAEKLAQFHLLLPDTSELALKLDCMTRAELGRDGQFRAGNTITLYIDNKSRGVPTVDTQVISRQTLREGPYSGNNTVLVMPIPDSFAVADKRRRQRIATSRPARLGVGHEEVLRDCVLADFSELTLRLDALPSEPEALAPQTHVMVEIDTGQNTHSLRGSVVTHVNNSCIVKLEQIFKYGRFDKMSMMDCVEIKTELLNHPPSRVVSGMSSGAKD